MEPIKGLGPGETSAIHLASELPADLLLIDEIKGRQAAIGRRILTVRTAAVLFDAANAGIISDLATVFEKLKATNFRVPHSILDELVRLHRLRSDQK